MAGRDGCVNVRSATDTLLRPTTRRFSPLFSSSGRPQRAFGRAWLGWQWHLEAWGSWGQLGRAEGPVRRLCMVAEIVWWKDGGARGGARATCSGLLGST